MFFKDPSKWRLIMSGMYAFGVWTMIGSLACRSGLCKFTSIDNVEADENTVVYQTAHTKTVIFYKKDFVPLRKRVSNFFNSSSSEDK